jgi:hypothetical protein
MLPARAKHETASAAQSHPLAADADLLIAGLSVAVEADVMLTSPIELNN